MSALEDELINVNSYWINNGVSDSYYNLTEKEILKDYLKYIYVLAVYKNNHKSIEKEIKMLIDKTSTLSNPNCRRRMMP